MRTPNIQAILNRNAALPTLILGLMLLIKPGRFGTTETRRVTAALQFYLN